MTGLERLNTESAQAAAEELRRCCGASAWVEGMLHARPFRDAQALFAEAERAWAATGPEDWREAFTHHPKIGSMEKLRERFGATAAWSAQEQSGVAQAGDAVLQALADGNRAYEERFGFIFIVCATGKSAEELLGLLRQRLPNPPDQELRLAAAEQAKITRIRLEKLLAS